MTLFVFLISVGNKSSIYKRTASFIDILLSSAMCILWHNMNSASPTNFFKEIAKTIIEKCCETY